MDIIEKVKMLVKEQPFVVAGAVAGVGLVVWYRVKNAKKPAPAAPGSTAAPAPANPDGYDIANLAGIPYGYNVYSGPVDNFPVNNTPNSNPVSSQELGVLRLSQSSGGVNRDFDTEHPQGVPIRATPSPTASIIGYAPFGSELGITGHVVTGENNELGAAPGVGSTLWYPVNGGYVSSYDFTNVLQNNNKGSGGFSHHVNSYRNTIDEMSFNHNLHNQYEMI